MCYQHFHNLFNASGEEVEEDLECCNSLHQLQILPIWYSWRSQVLKSYSVLLERNGLRLLVDLLVRNEKPEAREKV